jgi:hypothetical protein
MWFKKQAKLANDRIFRKKEIQELISRRQNRSAKISGLSTAMCRADDLG